jgi:ABC-type multidrug transport system fused ATPase/permease subunit
MRYPSLVPEEIKHKKVYYAEVFSILTRSQKSKLLLSATFQACLGFLDLLGLALIGLLGAVSVELISLNKPTDRISIILKFMQIENYSPQIKVVLIACLAALILVLKTILSMYLMRKNLRFLSNLSANVSSSILQKVLSRELVEIRKIDVQAYVFAITEGVNALLIGILGILWSLFVDVSLLLILGISLFIFSPLTALVSTMFFGGVGLILLYATRSNLKQLGSASRELTITSSQTIYDAIQAFRDLIVQNQVDPYIHHFHEIREKFTKTQADIAFMPHLSKYIFESSLIVGGLLVSGLQFAIYDSKTAVTSMTVFIASSSRIVPALLRIQYSLIQLNTNKGIATSALNLIHIGSEDKFTTNLDDSSGESHKDVFIPQISIKKVNFKYPNSNDFTLRNINLEVRAGQFIAIVGPSGSGKSTLVDLILGVLSPSEGEVLISGELPRTVFQKWPGAVSYLPQDVYVLNSTIGRNVSFPYLDKSIDRSRVIETLAMSQFIEDNSEIDIDVFVGEFGSKLSGGQKQRLGMARALYTKPFLLVLDEATSALDAETEYKISATLKELHGKVTVVVIAHRLSTVKDADEIIYIDAGEIKARGTFDSLRSQVTEFDRQANLMGFSSESNN